MPETSWPHHPPAGPAALRRRAGWPARLLVGLLSLSIVSGCVMNRARGRSEFSLVSPAQELALGKQGDAQIQAQFGVYEDPRLGRYVQEIGARVAAHSDSPDHPFTFRILDSPVVNAFALPGGYIYVTRGLLGHLANEAQLATILGHEIAHVTARHTAEQMTRQQVATVGLLLGGLLSDRVAPFLGTLAGGMRLLFLQFSRDAELEADTLAVAYAGSAGYPVAEAAAFFETLDRLESKEGHALLPVWTSTHPPIAERHHRLIAMAEAYRQEHPSLRLLGGDPADYLPRINGLVYGPDPRQGFVEANTFYHPGLRFRFPVPPGWKLVNLASEVRLAPADADDTAVILQTMPGTSLDALIRDFHASSGTYEVRREPGMIHGLKAVKLLSQASTPGGTVRILSHLIAKEDRTYVFHGVTPLRHYRRYLETFNAVAGGFAPLTDPTILGRQPRRLRLVSAPRAAAFRTFVGASGDVAPADIAILNQRQPEERVPAGTLLKLVH